MNGNSSPVSGGVTPPSTSRWLTNRPLLVALIVVLSAGLLLLDRPTPLHWTCVAVALRMIVVLILVMFVLGFGRPAQRAIWGAVTGIVAIDLAFSALLFFSGSLEARLLAVNPFVIVGAIVGAVAAMSNAAFGILAGVICYCTSVALLYGFLVWQSMQPRDPNARCCFPVELALFGILTIGVPVVTILSLIAVGSVKVCIHLRLRKQPITAAVMGHETYHHQDRFRSLTLLGPLILLLSVSLYLGWWTRPAFLSTSMRLAVNDLLKHQVRLSGGKQELLGPYYGPWTDWISDGELRNITAVNIYGNPLHDRDLALLKDLPNVSGLAVSGGQVSDAGMAHLKNRPQLKSLYISSTDITDTGLAELQHLKSLNQLTISNTQITGAGLKHLQGLANLETLDLTDSRIDDAALAHIGAMTSLKRLNLQGTHISDQGLDALKSLKKCAEINLSRTQVGDGALTLLQNLPQINSLSIQQTQVSPAAAAQINLIFRKRHGVP